MNQVTIQGNLTRDPEMKYLQGGAALCRFTVAVNETFKINGEDHKKTHFIDVNCWKAVAEAVTQRLRKGASVIVVGKLQQEKWEDKATHEQKSKITITAHAVGESLFQKNAPTPTPASTPVDNSQNPNDDNDIPF